MVFDWDKENNERLKRERGVGFERAIIAVEQGDVFDVLEHPNKERDGNQMIIVVRIEDYAYAVPAVREKEGWFLKTMFPSRKYTDIYIPGERRRER